jgi:hypothetical protein
MDETLAAAAALLRKYEALAALRARREEAQAAGELAFAGAELLARRAHFTALAAEFPGCLRELDTTPAALLAARAEALRAALAGAPVPGWVVPLAAFHQAWREALRLKRWLAEHRPRGGDIDAALVAACAAWWPTSGLPGEAPDQARLHTLLNPPEGRVAWLIWAGLEARFGEGRQALESKLFAR